MSAPHSALLEQTTHTMPFVQAPLAFAAASPESGANQSDAENVHEAAPLVLAAIPITDEDGLFFYFSTTRNEYVEVCVFFFFLKHILHLAWRHAYTIFV